MLWNNRIVVELRSLAERDDTLRETLMSCIKQASWQPPGWCAPITTLERDAKGNKGFYDYLNEFLTSTPVDDTFGGMFHGLYYIVSQHDDVLQTDERFRTFQEWMAMYAEQYGAYLDTPASANNLYSFVNDPAFVIEEFQVPPGGYNSFNAFFCRFLKPGKRPIGTETCAYTPPSKGVPVKPVGRVPKFNPDEAHGRMANDAIITIPADSVFMRCEGIVAGSIKGDDASGSRVTVSKGNTYYIKDLLAGSAYAQCFESGLFTHSYLTPFTYHRYHTPVRGSVLETNVISDRVFAHVRQKGSGLSADDPTGYQFRQDRALIILDSPVGKVGLVPIGMDFVSSCNLSVSTNDYLNKGDEFGYFLFGGSDLIMLFEKDFSKQVALEKGKLYKLGQQFLDLSNT